MPTGVDIQRLSGLTGVSYVIDPAAFRQQTKKIDKSLSRSYTWDAGGSAASDTIPRANVVSDLTYTFTGTLKVTAAASGQTQPKTGPGWPYGLLREYDFNLGGASNLWSVNGEDLRALAHARHPGHVDGTDAFPGTVGGGDAAFAAGSYDLYLTFPVGIALDPYSLVASLALQSNGSSPQWSAKPASVSELIASGGTSSLWEITGTLKIQDTSWEIPVNTKGDLILPDVSVVHQVVAHETNINSTGEQESNVLRSKGNLERMFVSARDDTAANGGVYLNFGPSGDIAKLRWEYGLEEAPSIFDPATVLMARNNFDYGSPLPYDRVCFDQLTHDPVRDAVVLSGITEARVVLDINSGTTLNAGARIRVVEEVLS